MPVPAGTFHYYVAPFVRETRDDGVFDWLRPSGAKLLLNAKPRGQRTFDMFGIFAVNPAAPAPENSTYLGDDINGVLSVVQSRDLEERLNLDAGDLSGDTLVNSLWRIRTELADASGRDRMRPLLPNRSGQLRMALSSHGGIVRSEQFDPLAHAHVLPVLRLNAESMRDDPWFQANDPMAYRRFLGKLESKFGFKPWHIIPGETSLPSRSTYGDDFTDSHNTDLDAHTATCTGGGWDWTVTIGDPEVENNAMVASTDGFARARSDQALSSDDHKAQALITDNGGSFTPGEFWYAGICTRFASGADEHYAAVVYTEDGAGSTMRLYEVAIGSTLLEETAISYDDSGQLVELESDGSEHTVTWDGSPVTDMDPFTDSTYSGQTQCGVYGLKKAGTGRKGEVDDFEFTDELGGGGGGGAARKHLGALTGVGR